MRLWTRHHGTGRSCARELLSDVRSPLSHRMKQTTINLDRMESHVHVYWLHQWEFCPTRCFSPGRSLLCKVYCLGTIEQNPWKRLLCQVYCVRSTVLGTIEQNPWKSWRGSQSQNTCPCASVVFVPQPRSPFSLIKTCVEYLPCLPYLTLHYLNSQMIIICAPSKNDFFFFSLS